MNNPMTDERALELLRALHTTGGSAMTTNDRCSIGTALDHIASRLQAQKSDEKLADTQRAIIEAAESRGYRRGIEEAQQPGAQSVAPYGWHCVWRTTDGRADWDQFHPSNDPPPTKWDEPPHAIIPLFPHPQPPSIPEPSEEDAKVAECDRVRCLKAISAYGSAGVDERHDMAMRAALKSYRARLMAKAVPND